MGTMDCLSWEVEERGRHLQMKGGRVGGSKDEANQCNSHSNSSGSGGESRREGGREQGWRDERRECREKVIHN